MESFNVAALQKSLATIPMEVEPPIPPNSPKVNDGKIMPARRVQGPGIRLSGKRGRLVRTESLPILPSQANMSQRKIVLHSVKRVKVSA